MARRALWILLALVLIAIGGWAVAGAVLGRRYDERMAAFRGSEAYAEVERHARDISPEDNAAQLLAEAWPIWQGIREEHDLSFVFPYKLDDEGQRARAAETLRVGEPFLAAVARAMERSAVQYPPDGSPASGTRDEARSMLVGRARLEPDRAAETGDLLLRLALRWRTRSAIEPLMRGAFLMEALKVVRDVLARDPAQAKSRLNDWQGWLAAEDSISEFRFYCAATLVESAGFVEQIRRGEDPLAATRETVKEIQRTLDKTDRRLDNVASALQSTWHLRWYGRPVLYRAMIAEHDHWERALDTARTEEGLRTLVGNDFRGTRARQAIEHLAVARIARVALAIAAGDAPPQLDDPFTGQPLSVRRDGDKTVIAAIPPDGLRLMYPELMSWEVVR